VTNAAFYADGFRENSKFRTFVRTFMGMKTIFLVLALLIQVAAFAQTPARTIHHREQAWVAYFNQTRLTNKWGLWLDVHYRMTDNFSDRPFQLLIRPGVTYFN
jgi:hypothetical protein